MEGFGKVFTIKGGNEESMLFWEEYGLRLLVPQNAVPESVASCRITVKLEKRESFMLPCDSTPVSAVYSISCSCNDELQKPIRIGLQHCAELSEPSHCSQLSFAKAISPVYDESNSLVSKATHNESDHSFSKVHYQSDRSLPYQSHHSFSKAHDADHSFIEVDDGYFSVESDYGYLDCSSFSLFTIIQQKINKLLSGSVTRYKLFTFYEHAPGTNFLNVYFVVTKNIIPLVQVGVCLYNHI